MTPARPEQPAGTRPPTTGDDWATTGPLPAHTTAWAPSRAPGRRPGLGRGVSALAAVALCVGGVLAVPGPAAAAPAPCEHADRYAAQSGAEFLHINKLDAGDSGKVTGVGLADAKSALVAASTVNAAAVTRMVDAKNARELSKPLIQQAPPTHPKPARRNTARGDVGPFALGGGTLSSHAQWDPRMACGAATGDVTRAEAALENAGVGGDLVRVPKEVRSLSTTALANGARTVARAGVRARGFDLLGGAFRVKVLRPPTLLASMSTKDGGEVRYVPAVLEVSGHGISTSRLDTPGDDIELALNDELAPNDDEAITGRDRKTESDGLSGGPPLPLPAVPGLPPLDRSDESAQVTGPGTRLRIALGDVRQANSGHAIAARATAITIAITRGRSDSTTNDGYGNSAPVLDLDIGVLEAAAVAPEPGGGPQGAVAAGGAGGGLPITGPRVDLLAVGGVALLVAGAAALTFGLRRRRTA